MVRNEANEAILDQIEALKAELNGLQYRVYELSKEIVKLQTEALDIEGTGINDVYRAVIRMTPEDVEFLEANKGYVGDLKLPSGAFITLSEEDVHEMGKQYGRRGPRNIEPNLPTKGFNARTLKDQQGDDT